MQRVTDDLEKIHEWGNNLVQVNAMKTQATVFSKKTNRTCAQSFNVPTETQDTPKQEVFSRPSLYSNHLSNSLNYRSSIFIVDHEHQETINHSIKLISKPFPCDTHLLTLRTQPDPVYSQFPSSSALMVLHRQGYECTVSSDYTCDLKKFETDLNFEYVSVKEMEMKSLTGLNTLFNLRKFSEIYLEPMSLKTINVTFG